LFGQQYMVSSVIVNGARTTDQAVHLAEFHAGIREGGIYRVEMQFPRSAPGVATNTGFAYSDDRDLIRSHLSPFLVYYTFRLAAAHGWLTGSRDSA
jgi:hypothetical protein